MFFSVGCSKCRQLREPAHDIVPVKGSDDHIGEIVRDAVARLAAGGSGKKLLLKFEDD